MVCDTFAVNVIGRASLKYIYNLSCDPKNDFIWLHELMQ